MKKRLIMVAAVALCAVCVFGITSCEKDSSCTCTESGSYAKREISPASYGARTCSDLELKLQSAAHRDGYNNSYSCI